MWTSGVAVTQSLLVPTNVCRQVGVWEWESSATAHGHVVTGTRGTHMPGHMADTWLAKLPGRAPK